MKHTRYNDGRIRPRGNKFLAEINRNYKALRKVFSTQEQCRAWIDQEQLTAQRIIAKPNQRQLIDADDARKILPKGISLSEAAKFWITHHKQNPLAASSLSDLYERYLKEKTAAGLRSRSIADIRANIGRLSRDLGNISISDISPVALHDYLNAGKYSPVTRNNLRRYWWGFFEYCRKLGAISDNPAESITVSRMDEKMPGIFTPDQAEAVLTTARKEYPKLIPFLAIGMFAGLRSSEIIGLDWSNISSREIRVIPEVAKKRRQRLVQMPDNLRKILIPYRKQTGNICPLKHRQLYVKIRDIAMAAGLKEWPPNAMRHSFASYHLALYHDAAKTAMLLGHTQNASVLWDHYRELVTKDDARKYFTIKIGAPD